METPGGHTPRRTSQNFCCQCPCPRGEPQPPPTSAGVLPTLADGELNVLDDILTEVPEQDNELYNPESEQDKK